MEKPIKPRKPSQPVKPTKTIIASCYSHRVGLDDNGQITLQDIFNKWCLSKSEKNSIDLSKIIIETYSEDGYHDDVIIIYNKNHNIEIPDDIYKKQMTYYIKMVTKYPQKKEAYDKKMIQYEENLEIYQAEINQKELQ